MRPNLNQTYFYETKKVHYTAGGMSDAALEFNNKFLIRKIKLCWVELEVFLRLKNSIRDTYLIDKTFILPKQLDFLGEELFKGLEREGLQDIGDELTSLTFIFKIRSWTEEYF